MMTGPKRLLAWVGWTMMKEMKRSTRGWKYAEVNMGKGDGKRNLFKQFTQNTSEGGGGC